MGTRGAWGFRCNDKDKVTYCHYDSYPDGLGMAILKFVKECSDVELKCIAETLELVDESDKPTPEQIRDCEEVGSMDLNVGRNKKDDWYCLLRNAQGKPSFYKKGLRILIDSHSFLRDSLFCEWAYILNTDTNKLEIYRGFNKTSGGTGRYASFKDDEYYGVKLLKEVDFEEVRKLNFENFCQELSEMVYGKEEEDNE